VSAPLHALQHASLLGGAVASWWVALHGRHGRLGYGLAVVWLFLTALHTGLLGALLTLSPTLWYPLQAGGGGIEPIEDQQLGGLIMWVPSGVVHTVAGLLLFAAWLRAAQRRSARRATAAAHLVTLALVCTALLGGCRGSDDTAVKLTGGDPKRG